MNFSIDVTSDKNRVKPNIFADGLKLGFTAVLISDANMLDLCVFGAAHLFSQVRSTQPTMFHYLAKCCDSCKGYCQSTVRIYHFSCGCRRGGFSFLYTCRTAGTKYVRMIIEN